jgi:hypothetical protein
MKGLYVHSDLVRFRDCLLNYRYPDDKEKRSKLDTSREKPIHDQYSHAMRALEYYSINVAGTESTPIRIIGYQDGIGGVKIPIYDF